MYTFQQNDFSSNMFVDTKNALLTIPSLNFLLRSYFSSPQNAKKMNNFAFFSEKRLFLGAFAGQGKSSCDSYAGINSLNSGIISAQSLYRSTKFQIFRVKFYDFSSKCLLDTRTAVLTTKTKLLR